MSQKFLLSVNIHHHSYLVDLGLPESDYGVPVQGLEGVHLALVVEEVLHDAGLAPWCQDARPVKGGVELAESIVTV